MLLQGQVAPEITSDGVPQVIRLDKTAAVVVADYTPRYLESVYRNNVFSLTASAAAPTAYTGGAAGTPLLAIHNPSNSGKILVPLAVGFAQRAAATAAGDTDLAFWAGPSVAPTGTTTAPRNALSLATSGSAALGFVNTALTGSTALALALPLLTLGEGAAATAMGLPGLMELMGLLVAAQGNQIALGVTAVPTSMTVDVALYWMEIPV